MNWLIFTGAVVLCIGLLLIILGVVLETSQESNVDYGGFILIGPVPILFGNSKQAVTLAAIGTVVLIAIALLLVNQIQM